MGWISRLTGRASARDRAAAPTAGAPQRGEVQRHLAEWVRTRTGVEAFLEPATTVTPATVLLVAGDGEWTRRPVPDPRSATDFLRSVGVRTSDVNLTGYPPRMREWNARVKAEEENARRELDG